MLRTFRSAPAQQTVSLSLLGGKSPEKRTVPNHFFSTGPETFMFSGLQHSRNRFPARRRERPTHPDRRSRARSAIPLQQGKRPCRHRSFRSNGSAPRTIACDKARNPGRRRPGCEQRCVVCCKTQRVPRRKDQPRRFPGRSALIRQSLFGNQPARYKPEYASVG